MATQLVKEKFAANILELKGWVEGLFVEDDGRGEQGNRPSPSARWLAIFLSLVVFFYNMAVPLVSSKKSVYMDLRVGILIWLFTSALLHTPLGSSQVEDHPTILFVSVFILLLVVTHITLAAFTMLHHIFAWGLGLFAPRMAETLWVPALRSMRSFKTILKASVVLSATLSTLFAYCATLSSHATCKLLGLDMASQECSEQLSAAEAKKQDNWLLMSFTLICEHLLPRVDDYLNGSTDGERFLEIKILGFDIGRLSLLESPIGLLWISGVAVWSTYYTLRRTKRINQTLHERAKRKKMQRLQKNADRVKAVEGQKAEEEDEDEASDEEYDPEESESMKGKLGPDRIIRKAPKNFLPMAEWYSLALTETAFQVLVSMKLFLGRFDMRTLQAALPDDKGQDDDEIEDEAAEDARTDTGYESAFSHRGHPSKRSHFDSRFAKLDEMWFDWMADTGDGGNPTYAIARAIAQPELELPSFRRQPSEPSTPSTPPSSGGAPEKENENQSQSDASGPVKLEKLKRGDLLLIGGDLAYPTPSIKEYDQRLFVPFEYAMEPPASYHRDDISMSKFASETGARMNTQLSFVKLNHEFGTSLSLPDDRISRQRPVRRSATLTERELKRSGRKLGDTFQIGSMASLASSTESSSTCSCEDTKTCHHQRSNQDRVLSDQPGSEEDEVRTWKGPPCAYAIPGNHDWFDGLHTYMQCICYRDWLGGWRLPQTKSYFALQLPHGWWIFAMDFGLNDDIDGLQYQYFASVASKFLGEDDQVILASHEPTWVLDAYMNHPHPEDEPLVRSSKNLKQLMRRHLRGKVALRIAGDIHNYMRHDAKQPLNESALRAGASPVLVVSGGGGAFLHPTHSFPERFKETGAHYSLNKCFPNTSQSRRVGMHNLGQGFRLQNWKFDFVGSTAYFLMVASFFPRCRLDHIMNVDFYPSGVGAFLNETMTIFGEIWTEGVVSLLTVLVAFGATYSFADYHYGHWRQLLIGIVHVSVHVFAAITLFLLLEIAVEVAIRDGLAGQGYDSFFNSFQSFERRTMPEAWWTSGLLVTPLKTLLRVFDLPENMATTRVRICTGQVARPAIFAVQPGGSSSVLNATAACLANAVSGMPHLTRFEMLTYYGGNFLFLFVIASDIVAMVLGFYLYICVNFLQLHWNEAFSSIRSPDYKSFMRFHIDQDGDLHAYAIGIDRVPREWRQDRRWASNKERLLRAYLNKTSASANGTGNDDAELNELDPDIASYGAQFPSRWIPAYTRSRKQRKEQEPRIVDYFCIPRKRSWQKIRRGNSVIEDDWWTAFGNLERRKVFKKTQGSQLNLAGSRREAKSQSPVASRSVHASLSSLGSSMRNNSSNGKLPSSSSTSSLFHSASSKR